MKSQAITNALEFNHARGSQACGSQACGGQASGGQASGGQASGGQAIENEIPVSYSDLDRKMTRRSRPTRRWRQIGRGRQSQSRWRQSQKGFTLIELIVSFSILLILSTMALPLAHMKVQRERERQLRIALAEIRKAIDRHKDAADAGTLGQFDPDTYGYPESLDLLVEGVPMQAGGMGGMGGQQGFGQSASSMGNRSRGGMGGGGFGGGGMSGGSRGGMGGGGFGGGGMGGGSRGGMGGGSRGGVGGGGFGGGGMGGGSRGGMGGGGFGGSSGGMGNRGGGMGGRSGSQDGMRSDDDEEQTIRFLRRIPLDPITRTTDWGIRAVQDDPGAMNWGGGNVFDVFTKSMDMALDGSRYSEW